MVRVGVLCDVYFLHFQILKMKPNLHVMILYSTLLFTLISFLISNLPFLPFVGQIGVLMRYIVFCIFRYILSEVKPSLCYDTLLHSFFYADFIFDIHITVFLLHCVKNTENHHFTWFDHLLYQMAYRRIPKIRTLSYRIAEHNICNKHRYI